MGCGRAGTRAARAKWRSEGARRGLGAHAGKAGSRRRGWRGVLRARLRRVGVAERQGSSGAATQRGRGDDGGVACVRQVHGRPVWALRRRGGASPCACRGVRVNGLGVSGARGVRTRERGGSQRRAGLERGEEQRRGQAAGSEQGRQRLSAAAGARAACLNACARREGGSQRGRERGERKREWRERKESPLFDLAKTRNFQLKLEKF
ncbi:hypothetical protein PVAP13_7NG021700 [Panicum virgatum]|uniref:Uncharacterized protein n=1 Tax=Panicum virgatum TaxID=38727 RepID=A0A8T0PUR9_PANVG|nr:hypothetical protein PVAP13_7NG021700 [Panicum virgatum]